MEHDVTPLNRLADRIRVAHVSRAELDSPSGFVEIRHSARGQIVEDANIASLRGEALDEFRADESGAAGDEDRPRVGHPASSVGGGHLRRARTGDVVGMRQTT
jgi:hypothetical protein